MGRGIVAAWVVGLGLLTWREVREYRKPVPAGRYAVASGLYAILGLAANYQPAASSATALAWAFDLALILQPGMIPGTSSPASRAAAATGTTQKAGTTTAAGRG